MPTIPVNPKCLTAGCNSQAAGSKDFRGLCMKCYSSAKKYVESGSTSWEELERLGMVRSKEQDDPFLTALKDKKRQLDKDIPF